MTTMKIVGVLLLAYLLSALVIGFAVRELENLEGDSDF